MKHTKTFAALALTAALIAGPGYANTMSTHHCSADKSKPCHDMMHLPKAKQELLKTTMKKNFEDNKSTIDDMHKLDKQREDILAAPTFDKDAYISVSKKIHDDHDQVEESRTEAFASIADQFTPKERAEIGHMGHHMHHHGDWHKAAWHHGAHSQTAQPEQGGGVSPGAEPMNDSTPQSPPAGQ